MDGSVATGIGPSFLPSASLDAFLCEQSAVLPAGTLFTVVLFMNVSYLTEDFY